MNFVIVGLLISLMAIAAVSSKDYFRGCYYTNWSQHRTGIWQYLPEHYEPGLCSHLFYAFVSMGDDFKLLPIEKNDIDLYARINAFKTNQTDLKTILSFNGYHFSLANSARLGLMRKMLSDVDSRKKFINSVIEYVRLHNFDGFEINYIPVVDTKEGVALLVKEMREAFDKEAIEVNKTRLLLTIIVPPEVRRIEAGYDGKTMAESVDYLNVMAYDYHGAWENKTGFNTPVYERNGDGLSINSTFAYLIHEQKVPREKLVMGYATFGRGWILPVDSVPNQIPSFALGPSPAQPFTLTDGVASYFEVCSLIDREGYVVDFDPEQRAVFAFKATSNGGVWIGFDNVKSHEEELNYLIEQDLAGVFVYTLGMDDFVGHCSTSNGTYPLIKAIRKKLTA